MRAGIGPFWRLFSVKVGPGTVFELLYQQKMNLSRNNVFSLALLFFSTRQVWGGLGWSWDGFRGLQSSWGGLGRLWSGLRSLVVVLGRS